MENITIKCLQKQSNKNCDYRKLKQSQGIHRQRLTSKLMHLIFRDTDKGDPKRGLSYTR